MLKSYKNPRTPRKRARYERTIFEGIFQAMSANQGELMLSATEEKLLNMKTVSMHEASCWIKVWHLFCFVLCEGRGAHRRHLPWADHTSNGDNSSCEVHRAEYYKIWHPTCGHHTRGHYAQKATSDTSKQPHHPIVRPTTLAITGSQKRHLCEKIWEYVKSHQEPTIFGQLAW